jgi:hypothetical protein
VKHDYNFNVKFSSSHGEEGQNKGVPKQKRGMDFNEHLKSKAEEMNEDGFQMVTDAKRKGKKKTQN